MVDDLNKYPIWASKSRSNPQALYNKMREEEPIFEAKGPVTGNSFWFFTRYEDVNAVLKDQRFVKDVRKNLPPHLSKKYLPEVENPAFDAINRHMLNLDAPDHTRLRGLIHKAFTPRRIRDLEPRIEAIAQQLLAEMAGKPNGDLLADFAFPLPITVIAEMLGIHPEKRNKFKEWTNNLLFGTDETTAQLSVMEFVQYINELIEERRAVEQDDLLSALVRVEEDGDVLDHMELLSMVFLLLVAGHETTVNLIGNGTLALMQHPEQMALLQANPSLIRSAVEEMLRYNGPVETPTTRWASEDIEVNGVVIPQGDIVMPSLLGANRDPNIFANPNVFDITRDPNPHVAFGAGIHYCLGAPLARMEGSIAINALLACYPKINLAVPAEDLKWSDNLLIHGMQSLPVNYC